MFEFIRNALSSGPDTMMVVTVEEPGFVVASQLTPKQYEKKEEYTHTWTMEFTEPVRDGNQISHLNFREDGQITGQQELYSGEEATTMNMNPSECEIEVVAVTTEDEVRDTSRLSIREEIVTE